MTSIAVRANPLILQLTGKQTPATGLEGKFSVYHSIAIALARGQVGMPEYTDAAVQDPAIVALRSKVHVMTDAAVRSDEIYMSITTKDGHVYDKHVEHAVGSLQRPMSDADLETKFMGLAHGVLPEQQAKSLIAMCWKLESLPDITEIPRAGALLRG